MMTDLANSSSSGKLQNNIARQSFRIWVTGIYLVSVLGIYLLIFFSQKHTSFLDGLERPYSAFSRVFEKNILMSDFRGLDRFSWYDALYSHMEADLENNLNEATKFGEELLKWIEKNRLPASKTLLRLRSKLAVFYAEAGRMTEFISQTRELESGKPEVVEALMTAYFQVKEEADFALSGKTWKWIGDKPSQVWSFGLLRTRYLKTAGNYEQAESQKQILASTGKMMRLRYCLIWICLMILLLSGLVIAVLCIWPRFRPVQLQNASIPIPASANVLAGIIARSAFWGIAVMYGSQFIPLKWMQDISFMSLSFFSALPMIYYVRRYLIRPFDRGWAELFGLSLGENNFLKMVYTGVLLAFIDQAGSGLINALFQDAGRGLHWSEAIDEILIFGKPWEAGLDFFDSVVSASLFEEIACRGLLYGTLRKRFGAFNSVLISGVFFSAIHFYSLAGFFEVLWSGMVWAYAYERTRSLWPGIISHALNNFFICLSTVLLYR